MRAIPIQFPKIPEILPRLEDLFFARLLLEIDEDRGGMPVGDRNANTLGRDERRVGFDDLAVLDATPDAQGFLLALLFFAADVGDDVVDHLRPFAEGLARAADRLIGRGERRAPVLCAVRQALRFVSFE